MRSKKPFFVASFLCGWTIVTYFLWTRQVTEVDVQHKSLLNKLNYLESSIEDEENIHVELLRKLIKVIKSEAETVSHIIIPTSMSNSMIIGNQESNKIDNLVGNSKETASTSVKEVSLDNNKFFFNDKLSIILQELKEHSFTGPVIPVLVFACNRISVSKCLDNLIEYRPNPYQFPIIVSQDCDDEPTRDVILSYKEVILISHPDQSDIPVPPKEKKFKGYYKIARHYGWALNTTFSAGFDYVIIVEDDLNVGPDFYEYFLGTHELLKNDSSLWCISAWNDNGKMGNIDEKMSSVLYRTDFFPGLGWMLTKDLWSELSIKWPKAYWDDWIRQPQQRKDRACIRPEISRTRTFGKIGVSK